MSTPTDLDERFLWVSRANVMLFGAAMVAGLVLHLASPYGVLSVRLLQAGLVLLMAAPALRILTAVAERIRRRDWVFVLMTAIVVVELGIVLWRAATR
ncbi:MAG: DUF1634 domain-containing protein [Vicinamibacterales bacterium]